MEIENTEDTGQTEPTEEQIPGDGEQVSPEPASVEQPKPDPVGERAALLARREQQLKSRESELETIAKKYEELERWQAKLAEDPLEALRDRGLDYAKLLEAGLNAPKDSELAKVQRELAAMQQHQKEMSERYQQAEAAKQKATELAIIQKNLSETATPALLAAQSELGIDVAGNLHTEFWNRYNSGNPTTAGDLAAEYEKIILADLEKRARLWEKLKPKAGQAQPAKNPGTASVPSQGAAVAKSGNGGSGPAPTATLAEQHEYYRRRGEHMARKLFGG
jgi:hypothetical protein